MTDYTWPTDLQPISNTLEWVSEGDLFRSPLTAKVRTLGRTPGHWRLTMTFDGFRSAHAQKLEAFLWRLDGAAHRAVIPDHSYRRKGTGTGTPRVNGAGQVGYTLITDGWSGTNPVLATGDRFSVNGQLCEVAEDCSHTAGAASIVLCHPLRESPPDNETLEVTLPAARYILVSRVESGARLSVVKGVVVEFAEDLLPAAQPQRYERIVGDAVSVSDGQDSALTRRSTRVYQQVASDTISMTEGAVYAGQTTDFVFVIAADTANWNLIANIGYTPIVPVSVQITVNAAVVVSSGDTATAALDLSGLPTASDVVLINGGYIIGRGGIGGDGAWYVLGNAEAGSAGGPAIKGPGAGTTLVIDNSSGYVYGGGGGGGGGGAAYDYLEVPAEPGYSGGGGGGGGAGGSLGGEGAPTFGVGGDTDGQDGSAGTGGGAGAGGSGGAGGTLGTGDAVGGAGGTGGAYGAAGSSGANGVGTNGKTLKGAGGSAGLAVSKNGAAVSFLSGGASPRVLGSIT